MGKYRPYREVFPNKERVPGVYVTFQKKKRMLYCSRKKKKDQVLKKSKEAYVKENIYIEKVVVPGGVRKGGIYIIMVRHL